MLSNLKNTFFQLTPPGYADGYMLYRAGSGNYNFSSRIDH
jgi:hypothetical protein